MKNFKPFYVDGIPDNIKPDFLTNDFGNPPSGEFIISRDKNGAVLSLYKDNTWDLSAYGLSITNKNRFHFHSLLGRTGVNQSHIDEMKHIMFSLIYYLDSGHIGRLSVSTLHKYYTFLRNAVEYCGSLKNNNLIGVISLFELLSNKTYISSFILSKKNSLTFNKSFPALIINLNKINYKLLNFKPVTTSTLKFSSKNESKQHVLIPTRIYLNLINNLSNQIDHISNYKDRLCSLIRCFSDPFYGTSHNTQKHQGVGGFAKHRPDWNEAVEQHGLNDFFVGIYECNDRQYLQTIISLIQSICILSIHVYTGMRREEVYRLSTECIQENIELSKEEKYKRVINIISSTTKFEGYKKEATWIASSEVIRSVDLASSIAKSLLKISTSNPEERLYLFPSSSAIVKRNRELIYTGNGQFKKGTRLQEIIPTITEQDLLELQSSDPERDFNLEEEFHIGMKWPLKTHQLRRSLAFYAASSGFVSLPSLNKQFKHLTRQMTQYYQNGFENLTTIFGFYDKEKDDFVLPEGHIAFEFQTGIPTHVANQLVHDLFDSDVKLFGVTGSFIEIQKAKIAAGELLIEDVKSDTLKKAHNGELRYRKTLLGGCTIIGECDSFLLGDFTECLGCLGAVIHEDKLDAQIKSAREELTGYEIGTGEYQVLKADLEKLETYKKNNIKIKETS